jgi:hypothetical protein
MPPSTTKINPTDATILRAQHGLGAQSITVIHCEGRAQPRQSAGQRPAYARGRVRSAPHPRRVSDPVIFVEILELTRLRD